MVRSGLVENNGAEEEAPDREEVSKKYLSEITNFTDSHGRLSQTFRRERNPPMRRRRMKMNVKRFCLFDKRTYISQCHSSGKPLSKLENQQTNVRNI